MAQKWKSSVSVRIGDGHSDAIRGPGDAFEFLTNRWPAERGPRYTEAKRLCSMAVGLTTSVEGARKLSLVPLERLTFSVEDVTVAH